MGAKTNISWTDRTWNFLDGCNRIRPGCAHCYAKTLHDMRFKAYHEGKQVPAQYALPFEHVQVFRERLALPLKWRKPSRIFVDSMSDLFHKDVPDEVIDEAFAVMMLADWHVFQILTKRPERQFAYMTTPGRFTRIMAGLDRLVRDGIIKQPVRPFIRDWPFRNVWLGASVENQRWANEVIPWLVKTPAWVRFLSCEPLIGPVNLTAAIGEPTDSAWDVVNLDDEMAGSYEPEMEVEECELENDWINYGTELVPNPEYTEYHRERLERARSYTLRDEIHWVIVGGESGPKRRPMDLDWARSLRDQCVAAGVPFFYKQEGGARSETGKLLDGVAWAQFPEGPALSCRTWVDERNITTEAA